MQPRDSFTPINQSISLSCLGASTQNSFTWRMIAASFKQTDVCSVCLFVESRQPIVTVAWLAATGYRGELC